MNANLTVHCVNLERVWTPLEVTSVIARKAMYLVKMEGNVLVGLLVLPDSYFTLCTAWKVSVFRVYLVRIFPHLDWYGVSPRIQSECGKIQTRKTPNMDTFHAVQVTAQKMKISVKKTGFLFTVAKETLNGKLVKWI